MRASLSERLSLRRSVCGGRGRGDGVNWGVLSTAATRRRESHGSEPAAPRAARSSRRQRLDRAPWAWSGVGATSYRGARRSPLGGDAATRQLESDGHVVRAVRAARSSAARTSCRPRPPGSAAPRAPRGDSWGRLIGGLPCFRHGGRTRSPIVPAWFYGPSRKQFTAFGSAGRSGWNGAATVYKSGGRRLASSFRAPEGAPARDAVQRRVGDPSQAWRTSFSEVKKTRTRSCAWLARSSAESVIWDHKSLHNAVHSTARSGCSKSRRF